MFSLILSFLSSKIPFKVWIYIFAVLIALGAFFWFKHSIYQECKLDIQAKQDAEKVIQLEQVIAEAKQKETFLLNNQRKNEDFIKRQRKALKDANEKDGDVSPLLRGGLKRLHGDREN